jgi:AraC family transcriptional regulator
VTAPSRIGKPQNYQTAQQNIVYSGPEVSVTGKALWYIESHLGEELSLDTIACAVGVSRFHLSRAFAVSIGCSLAGYVRARRLSQAALLLAGGAPEILAVAVDSGYSSHEAFTRAFRQYFGPPEQLRAQAHLKQIALQEPLRMDKTVTTTLASPHIEKRDAMLILGLSEHYGQSKAGIPSQWSRFVPHLGHIFGQICSVSYGVISNYDESGACDYLCGVAVKKFPAQPSEFTRLRIPRKHTRYSSSAITSPRLRKPEKPFGNTASQTLVSRPLTDRHWNATARNSMAAPALADTTYGFP